MLFDCCCFRSNCLIEVNECPSIFPNIHSKMWIFYNTFHILQNVYMYVQSVRENNHISPLFNLSSQVQTDSDILLEYKQRKKKQKKRKTLPNHVSSYIWVKVNAKFFSATWNIILLEQTIILTLSLTGNFHAMTLFICNYSIWCKSSM